MKEKEEYLGGGKTERFFSLSASLGALVFAKTNCCRAYLCDNVINHLLVASVGCMQPCVCGPVCCVLITEVE